ncbi:hypothetical protein [Micromonospora cathayae]|uniref:DUF3558 domain-containing protein n=1 Tax=Micromonospora cathayae TaxID=3028804 RepID=A0ABY7ZSH6_9ACTN|nr:hypothetical protein [Micromonospora sp. HUAS 3]WDZ84899.1 hypothetical protein PVK37_31605 [Micromonospora sp. HUAS 3]
MTIRTVRWVIIAIMLPFAVAGCADRPGRASVGERPAREFHLVENLCDQLDHERLSAASGGTPVKTRTVPGRTGHTSRCALSTGSPSTGVSMLQVDTEIGEPPTGEPRLYSHHREISGVGDHAQIELPPALTADLDSPVIEGPTSSRICTLTVVEGTARIRVQWTNHARKLLSDADTEALLVAYARETLHLMGS